MVHDLPSPVHLPPHVREARLHRLTVVGLASHEGVQASVQVGVFTVILHIVRRDGAVRELLEELHEVLPCRLAVTDELGGDGGEEGEIGGGVEGGDLVKVFCNQCIVPGLEICLQL